jgi:hypothetical protein
LLEWIFSSHTARCNLDGILQRYVQNGVAGNLAQFLARSMGMPGRARPARLGDMPAFYNVEVDDLVVSRNGNHFVVEFDQPDAAAKDPLQVCAPVQIFRDGKSHFVHVLIARP